jgi:hypothetical protein
MKCMSMAAQATRCFSCPPRLTCVSSTEPSAQLYIVRNGRATPEPSVVKATLPDISEKAVSSLIKTQGIGDLYRLYAIAKRDRIVYNYIDIPAAFTAEARSPFDAKYMSALYKYGYDMGLHGVGWKKAPPGFSRRGVASKIEIACATALGERTGAATIVD